MAPLTTKLRETKPETDKAKQEIERLRSACDLYKQYKEQWDFFLDAYEGGKEFAKNKENLFRHTREHQKDFDDRVKRSHYLNYCKPLVEFPVDFIFQETIQRNGGSDADFFNKFVSDVNKKGEDVTSVMRSVDIQRRIFGMMWMLVDMPRFDASSMSQAEADAKGIRPYWVIVRPDEVLDWVVDDFDNVLYWKRQQIVFVFNEATGEKRKVERYTEWSQNSIKVTDIDITEDDKPILQSPTLIPNKLKEVPVTLFRYERSLRDKFMGLSFLNDIAYNNLEVLNLTSLLQEFLYRQCFNMLAMEVDNDQDEEEQQDGEFSTSNVITFPKDSSHPPHYISPPVDPAKFLQEERSLLVLEMYKRASQDLVNELSNGNKASGYSKQQSFIQSASKIASAAETLEKGEMRLMSLTEKWRGKTWDGKIKYRDNYQVTNIADQLDLLKRLFVDLQLESETFLKEQLKRMVLETDGKMTPDMRAKVEAEIEKMDAAKYFETMRLNFIGRAAMSPEAETSAVPGTAAAAPNPKEAAAQSAPSRPAKSKTASTQSELKAESSKTPKAGSRKAKAKSK
jgi:hypothetical protein